MKMTDAAASLCVLLALLVVTGCGDSDSPVDTPPEPTGMVMTSNTTTGDPSNAVGYSYLDDNQYVLARSHANVIRRIDVVAEDEPGVAQGFDLDGRVSEDGDPDSCNHGDLMSPDGQMGIDNQLATMWTALKPLVGDAVEALLRGAINEGRIILVAELTDVDDIQNDDDVTFNLLRGILNPLVGTEGYISPDQTVLVDYDYPVATAENIQIIDGEFIAGPVQLEIPIDILTASFTMTIPEGWIRAKIQPDGSFKGILGGAFDVPAVLNELYETNAADEAYLVTPIFEENADMGMVDGQCNFFSVAFHIEGATAFVIRDSSRVFNATE